MKKTYAFPDAKTVQEELRPYFSLSKVMDGLFKLAKTLFGIDIEPADGLAPVNNFLVHLNFFSLPITQNTDFTSF